MKKLLIALCGLLIAGPVMAGVVQPPATSLPVANPSPYNFYDKFTGTVAVVSGRSPDTVSNGNTWTGTGAGVANYQAGGGALQITSGSSFPAYAVMHTTCTGAPEEVGGTFKSSNAFSPTLASALNYASYGFNAMVHPNITVASGGGFATSTTGIWDTASRPGGTNIVGQSSAWTGPAYAPTAVATNTSYTYQAFFRSGFVTARVTNTATGALILQSTAYDPLGTVLSGPDVFFETGDLNTQWTSAWARCAQPGINNQTSALFPSGIAGPIGLTDPEPGVFSSVTAGVTGTQTPKGTAVFWTDTTHYVYVIGKAQNGHLVVTSDTSGFQAYLDLTNGAGGTSSVQMDGAYLMNFINNGATKFVVPYSTSQPFFPNGLQLTNASGPSYVAVIGAPTGACTTGSLRSRTDGGTGSTLYVCESSAWVAK